MEHEQMRKNKNQNRADVTVINRQTRVGIIGPNQLQLFNFKQILSSFLCENENKGLENKSK